MRVNLEAKTLFKSKNLSEYWSNINTPSSQLQPNLSYLHSQPHMVEAGVSHVNAISIKQINRLNLKNRGDL